VKFRSRFAGRARCGETSLFWGARRDADRPHRIAQKLSAGAPGGRSGRENFPRGPRKEKFRARKTHRADPLAGKFPRGGPLVKFRWRFARRAFCGETSLFWGARRDAVRPRRSAQKLPAGAPGGRSGYENGPREEKFRARKTRRADPLSGKFPRGVPLVKFRSRFAWSAFCGKTSPFWGARRDADSPRRITQKAFRAGAGGSVRTRKRASRGEVSGEENAPRGSPLSGKFPRGDPPLVKFRSRFARRAFCGKTSPFWGARRDAVRPRWIAQKAFRGDAGGSVWSRKLPAGASRGDLARGCFGRGKMHRAEPLSRLLPHRDPPW
jgi:hypothetical protein